jgi:hypothetical protein
MRSTFDIVDHLYTYLSASELKSMINGVVCKQRPINSTKEDVCINAIAITGNQFQEGVINVNIHVPNLKLKIGGQDDNTQPNYARLKILTNKALELLQLVTFERGHVIVSNPTQRLFAEPEINQHYTNLRLTVRSVNV